MTPDVGAGPIEAVIFDWGGTLTPWHPVDVGEQWRVFAREIHGVALGSPQVSAEDLAAAHDLAHRISVVEDAAWTAGRATHTSAHIDDILAQAGLDPEHDRHLLALAAYRGFWEPHTFSDPQVEPLWRGLKERGIKVGVLSNTIQEHALILQKEGVYKGFNPVILSCQVGMRKPNADIYQKAAKLANTSPSNCLLIDDMSENVEGAQTAGFQALLYRNVEELRLELHRMGLV